MARDSVTKFDVTPSNNTDINGINIGEGWAGPDINDAIRAFMGLFAQWIAAAVTLQLTNGSTVLDSSATPVMRGVGYRTLPPTAARSAAWTLALTDVAMMVPISAGGITIPANATTAFALGDIIVIWNNGTGVQPIAPASGVTLTQTATTNVGTRNLTGNGLATLLKVGTDSWLIYGVGLS